MSITTRTEARQSHPLCPTAQSTVSVLEEDDECVMLVGFEHDELMALRGLIMAMGAQVLLGPHVSSSNAPTLIITSDDCFRDPVNRAARRSAATAYADAPVCILRTIDAPLVAHSKPLPPEYGSSSGIKVALEEIGFRFISVV